MPSSLFANQSWTLVPHPASVANGTITAIQMSGTSARLAMTHRLQKNHSSVPTCVVSCSRLQRSLHVFWYEVKIFGYQCPRKQARASYRYLSCSVLISNSSANFSLQNFVILNCEDY